MKLSVLALVGMCALIVGGTAQAQSGYRPSGTAATAPRYILAPHPYQNPQDLFNTYEPVVRYLERKIPGVHFSIETSKDYAEYEAKIAARRFHFGIPNPYQAVLSFKHGYRAIAKMTPDEDFRGVMVVRADSKLNAPGDLAGQPLCFIAPSAVAATMLPLIYLHDHGVNIKTATITYVGSPASALTHVFSGGYPACGVSVRHWRAWSKDNTDKARALKILFTTPSLPHNAVIARDDVPAALAQQVASVLVGMDKDRELDQTQFRFDQNHYEHGTNQNYQPFTEFMRRYDEAIGLPAQMKLPSR